MAHSKGSQHGQAPPWQLTTIPGRRRAPCWVLPAGLRRQR